MVFGTLLCQLIPDRLMGLFLTDPAALSESARALKIISLGFNASAFSLTFSGMLEGLGKGLHSLCIMLLRNVIVIIPAAFILTRLLGNADGVWHSFWIAEWVSVLIAGFLYRRVLARAEKK